MPALAQLSENGDVQERAAAIITLGRIGSAEAVPILLKALDDEPELIVLASGALAKIGDRSAFDPLIKLMGHRSIGEEGRNFCSQQHWSSPHVGGNPTPD